MKIISIDHIMSTIIVLLVLIYLPLFFNIDFLDPIQSTLQDFQITDISFSRLQDNSKIGVDTNIILVNIGNLERRHIAKLIQIINRSEPKVIGIDSFFRELMDSADDEPLSNALSDVKNLVLVSKLENYNTKTGIWDTISTSHELFIHKNTELGFANYIINEDQFRTVRQFTPRERVYKVNNDNAKSQSLTDNLSLTNSDEHYAFAVKLCQIYKSETVKKLFERNNDVEVINFRRNIDKYLVIDLRDFFTKEFDFRKIKDKIVLMGYLGPDVFTRTTEDNFFTPMNNVFVGKNYPDMYGVVVWANIISMILDGKYYNSVPEWMSILFTILLIYFNMIVFTYMRDKFEGLYEAGSIIWSLAQLIAIFMIILWSFYLLGLEMKNAGAFLAVIIAKQSYELWNDSLKPISVRFVKKRLGRMLR